MEMLKKFIVKVIRSMGFLGGFIIGCRIVFCLSHRFIRPFNSKKFIDIDRIVSMPGWRTWLSSFCL